MKKIKTFLKEVKEANEYLHHVNYSDFDLHGEYPELNESFIHEDLTFDSFVELPKDVFTELVLAETLHILNESGSLPDVVGVPKNLADRIVGSFVNDVLKKMNIFKLETLTGLGSTRALLKKLPTAKSVSGDLDLLVVSKDDNRSAAKKLADWAKSAGLDFQIAFGNIFSVAWPYNGNKYQIDLMIANASENDEVYNYMRKFKYFSDEDPNQSGDFILKGAHRSELAKTVVKAIGLSAAENGFKQFMWNDKFSTMSELTTALEKKAARFRDDEKKQQTYDLVMTLTSKVRTLSKLKKDLTENGLLKSRYPYALFKNYTKAFDLMLDMLFDKSDISGSWEKILDKKFDISNSISKMNKFDDVLNLVKELLAKRIVTPRAIVGVMNEIKSAFDRGKAAGAWNRSLEEYIEKKLPFMKNYWS